MKKINAVILLVGLLISTGAMSAPDKVAYELQERCGKATKAEFVKEYGDGAFIDLKTSIMNASYKNHYNSKLNKCFYLLSTNVLSNKPNAMVLDDITLWDFNESNVLGEFRTQGTNSHCEFKGVDCKSKDSFDSLIKPYMEE